MNIMKQSIAMALVAYSLRFLLSKSPVPFVATILVAYLFHQSALIFIVLFPLYMIIRAPKQQHRFFRRIVIATIAIVGVGIIFVAGESIINYLASTRVSYSFMVKHADDTTLTSSTLVFIVFIVFSHIFQLVNQKKTQFNLEISAKVQSNQTSDTIFFLELLAIIGCLLSELSMVAAGLNRISYYMQYAMLLLIPMYLEVRDNQVVRNIQYLFIVLCILVAFKAASVGAYGAFPYTSQILGISGM
jgi:hypothetical protein